MTVRHTPARRDLYKAATATVTGLVAFVSVAGTGYAAGAIAQQQAGQQEDKQEQQDAAVAAPVQEPEVRTVARRRPHRTVVRTEVVHRASTAVAAVATGGNVTSAGTANTPTRSYSTSSSSSSTRSAAPSRSAPQPAPKAAQPAPKPAPKPATKPAPSSGS